MGRTANWFLGIFSKPGVLLTASVAYSLGIATVLPMGWELDTNAATAIAAGVTSLFAVGGSIAAWHYQQELESRAVATYFAKLLEAPLLDMGSLRTAYLAEDISTQSKSLIRQLSTEINSSLSVLSARSSAHIDLVLKLDPTAMGMLVDELKDVVSEVARQNERAGWFGDGKIGMKDGAPEYAQELVQALDKYGQFVNEIKRHMGVSQ